MIRQITLISLTILTVLDANPSTYYVKHSSDESKAELWYTITSVTLQPETTFDVDLDGTIEANIKISEDAVPPLTYKKNYVLVYPEYGLTSNKIFDNRDLARNLSQYIPWPGQLEIPCYLDLPDATHKMLKRMSCLAIEHQAYIVTHFIEREDCNDCELDNLKLYSTAVAFNKFGLVVAKYRKFHMYEETALDSASSVEVATFTTDFNVTFGIVMSFDLMFLSPVTILTEVLNITDILVPYAHPGVMPFLTPLQIQYSLSSTSSLNIISGCYLRPSEGYAGCGMYFGHDNSTPSRATLISSDNYIASSNTVNVTEKEEYQEIKNSTLNLKNDRLDYRRENLTEYVSITLLKTLEQQNISACHNTLCCNLTYTMFEYSEREINYKLLVFDGIKHHPNNGRSWRTQTCGVVACTAGVEGNDACTDLPDENDPYTLEIYFSELTLTGNFNSSYVFPSTLESDLFPFKIIEFVKEKDVVNNKFNVKLSLQSDYEYTDIFRHIHTFGFHSYIL